MPLLCYQLLLNNIKLFSNRWWEPEKYVLFTYAGAMKLTFILCSICCAGGIPVYCNALLRSVNYNGAISQLLFSFLWYGCSALVSSAIVHAYIVRPLSIPMKVKNSKCPQSCASHWTSPLVLRKYASNLWCGVPCIHSSRCRVSSASSA